ncbi:Na/Pi cotransporter family protein [Paracoccus shanxieyensis]|uniref:Na/Pi cotransporter family protein n=1 Tax=Paracoccus shanxieyensis TaxID=2675752 RepID=A0A6L6IT74_9RHOB|nr:Na/Pi cotransporter family protein [Paracoccus shanxieyensis]MTH63059.1 Na/Pi cotransporter family protein [Paracoccus shanxieyensis]MTH88952.1 Na/Pi cotransporter family protein [Paracoccus shanxieyensis]
MNSIAVILQLAGAVALLLFGLGLVRDGMLEAFGLRLKMILGFGTRSQPRAFGSGLLATLGLQSSTATALLTASFVDRQMIGGRMAQIVLLGANVGTALTAVLVSIQIEAVAPALMLLGYVLRKRGNVLAAGIGGALIGVGLMLVSLALLEHATLPMRDSPLLAAFLPMLDNAWPVALLMAAGIAVVCSSSLAAVLLIASIPLPPELTMVLVLGANLGGAVSPVLASAGLGAVARRVAVGNLLVRGIGCLVALPLVATLAPLLAGLPTHLTGLAVEGHLAFNLALAALIWPLNGAIGAVVERILPDDPPVTTARRNWLDDTVLDAPLLALSGASREVLAIGDKVERMLSQTRTAFARDDTSPLAEVAEIEDQIDTRQQEVKNYLSRLTGDASEDDRRRAIDILDYVINLEHIGDIIDKGLGPEVRKKIGLGLRFSDEGYQELERLFLVTQEALRMAQTVFMTRDHDMARRLMELKIEIRKLERQSAQRHLIRLREGQTESRETSSLHLDILRDLKRINAHAVSVAHPILDEQGLLVESRLRAAPRAAHKE